MTTLVIAEHDNASSKAATLNTVAAAHEVGKFVGGDIHVLEAGHNAQGAADAAAKIVGVSKVLLANAPHLEAGLAENVETTVLTIVQDPAKDYTHGDIRHLSMSTYRQWDATRQLRRPFRR